MKVAEDQVVGDDSGFQDDEVSFPQIPYRLKKNKFPSVSKNSRNPVLIACVAYRHCTTTTSVIAYNYL